MTKIPPMVFSDAGITIFINNSMLLAPTDHPNFTKVKQAITDHKFDLIENLLDIRKTVVNYVNHLKSDFTLVGDFLCYQGKPFTMEVTDKVLRMIEAGQPAEPIYNFLVKVRQNPLVSAQDELLLFCVANKFMIHEDGDIIAYKSVRGDYTDIYSGKHKNSVGSTLEMKRDEVDTDRNRTCSRGFHFAAFDYASTWSGNIDGVNRRLLVMKINPADVVAIPSDYNNQKGRTWKYTILSEIGGTPLEHKEVYTNVDLGVTKSTDVSELNKKAERDAEINRKTSIKNLWINKSADAATKRDSLIIERDQLQRIVDLNLDSWISTPVKERFDAISVEVKRLQNYIESLEQKINVITDEIVALQSL